MSVVRRKLIRKIVDKLLDVHNVNYGGPVPIEKIIRSMDIKISVVDADDELSGYIARDRNTKRTVIGVNGNHNKNRRRFTLAHECGHYLLHDNTLIHVDRVYRDKLSKDGTDIEEKEANLFAAELLMPENFIERDFGKHGTVSPLDEEAVIEIAERYGVSTQALTFRLAYLRYIFL